MYFFFFIPTFNSILCPALCQCYLWDIVPFENEHNDQNNVSLIFHSTQLVSIFMSSSV